MTEANITVYGAPWCPDCTRAKQFLGEQRVRYCDDTLGNYILDSHIMIVTDYAMIIGRELYEEVGGFDLDLFTPRGQECFVWFSILMAREQADHPMGQDCEVPLSCCTKCVV